MEKKITINGFVARMPRKYLDGAGKAPMCGFLTEAEVRPVSGNPTEVEVRYASAVVWASMAYKHSDGVLATILWHTEAEKACIKMHHMVVS